jgi:hypothetical protein
MAPDDRTWCAPYGVSQSARSCATMHARGAAHAAVRGPDAHRRNAQCESCADGASRAQALGIEVVQLRSTSRPMITQPPTPHYEPRHT